MPSKKGKLTVLTGPMFAEKTTQLIVRAQSSKGKSLIFKPHMDTRYSKGKKVCAHNGNQHEAELFDAKNPMEILKVSKKTSDLSLILIDEIQFCSAEIIEVLKLLLNDGLDVIAAGLNFDYKKDYFGSMQKIIKMAQETIYLTARCDMESCNADAIYTYVKKPTKQVETVGAKEIYGVACATHHNDLRGDLSRLGGMAPLDHKIV